MTARRDPGLAGVVGITADDLASLEAGRITMLDLASKLGVSKQAVSRRVSRMRSTSSTDASTSPSSTGPTIPAGAVLIDPHRALVSANLGILSYVNATLESGTALGPSAFKAMAGAVASARAELTALGVLAAPDDAETPTEFVIRVMTDQEHEETKRRVELPDED